VYMLDVWGTSPWGVLSKDYILDINFGGLPWGGLVADTSRSGIRRFSVSRAKTMEIYPSGDA
jgi:hypothetical protein